LFGGPVACKAVHWHVRVVPAEVLLLFAFVTHSCMTGACRSSCYYITVLACCTTESEF
jgi:hypothetical protein